MQTPFSSLQTIVFVHQRTARSFLVVLLLGWAKGLRHVSSSKRMKHIKAKYFFVRHHHCSGKVDLQYCPTEEMWADILTKPLQDSKFCLMWAFLTNYPPDYSEEPVFIPKPVLQPLPVNLLMKPWIPKIPTSLRECVGIQLHDTQVPSPSRKQILIPLSP